MFNGDVEFISLGVKVPRTARFDPRGSENASDASTMEICRSIFWLVVTAKIRQIRISATE